MTHRIDGILGNASALVEGAKHNLRRLDLIQDNLANQVDRTVDRDLAAASFPSEAEMVATTWFLAPEVRTSAFAQISREYPRYSIAVEQWAIFNEPAISDFKEWEAFLSK